MAIAEFTVGGALKALALAFGAGSIAAPAFTRSGRTAGAGEGHLPPSLVLPFARCPDALELMPELPMPPPPAAPAVGEIWRDERGAIHRDEHGRVYRAKRDVGGRAIPLLPKIAAGRFVAWLQEHGLDGDRPWAGANGVWELYLWHCDEERLTAIPDNMLGAALDRLCVKRLVRDYSSGKLRRPTYYTIPQTPAAKPAPKRPPQRTQKHRRAA